MAINEQTKEIVYESNKTKYHIVDNWSQTKDQ